MVRERKMKILMMAIILMAMACNAQAESKETTFDRVMRTQTLRCGYVVYPPAMMKDPNTGKMSGIFYDISEKMGERLHLKIEWIEINFPTMVEDLKMGRYDAHCVSGWGSAILAPYFSITRPLYYSVINPFVRIDDNRFDENKEAINNSSVRISTIDGTGTAVFADQSFPKAQRIAMPQDTAYSLTILNVMNKKADVVLVENSLAAEFMAKNPNAIRAVKLDKPLRTYGNGFMVGIHEQELLSMLDMTLSEMLGAGEIDDILAKYDNNDNFPVFLPVAAPYIIK